MGSANTSAGGPWPSPPYTTANEGWSLLAPLPVSPNPSSIQAAAPLQTVLGAQETHRRFRRQPTPLTGFALAGGVQVVVRAQQLALAVRPTVVHARR